ncbi:MAG: hypothetical protein D8M59_16540 [Planctomycetes bacterium]|nr:hypothetical protein [Planctomycetota bacterium]NOG53172.1 type IV secretory system conjugative DNA transfer family protein [Planctomycetota bacterium]
MPVESSMPSRDQVLELRRLFLKPLYTGLGIAGGIYVFPFKPQTPNNTFRLLLTIGFFAAAIYAVSRLLHARERYSIAMQKWKFVEAPPQIELLARKVVVREQNVYRATTMLGIACLTCMGIGMLSNWPQFAVLRPLHGVATMGFIGTIIGLGVLVYSGRSGWGAYVEVREALKEIMQTADYQPRDLKDPNAEQSQDESPVQASNEGFRAGSFDWRWDDLHKNAIVFGQPGTGKTICVLNALMDGLLASEQDSEAPPGGLILDPKGDFKNKIGDLLRKYGRGGDLMVVDPAALSDTIYWNPFDSDDDELELAARFASVLEVLGTKNTQDTFWIDSARKFLRHAIALVRMTNPTSEPPNFRDIQRLASSPDAIDQRLGKLPLDDPSLDIDPCLDFFEEWSQLGDRTRSSVQSQLTNMIDPFLMRPYRTVFGGQSTERIGDMIDNGRVLYVHMPIADKEAMSRTICTLIKLEFFREVLKRVNKQRNSFFLCDEFQVYMTAGGGKGDSDFFERSRQSRHANIIACQNIPALLKQTDQEKSVTNLLSNCAVKIFLRNTDQETNEYGSTLFGQRLMESASTSMTSGRGIGKSGESRNLSISAEYDSVVRPESFTKLGIPIPGERDHCESIIHLGSRAVVDLKRLKWKVHPL